jgi:hypothetical protein
LAIDQEIATVEILDRAAIKEADVRIASAEVHKMVGVKV